MNLTNIDNITPSQVNGFFYRIVLQKYEKDILGTEGSKKAGGRYNDKGIDGVLYLGENEAVAIAERKRKGPLSDGKFVIGKIEVKLDKVLNLTREENLGVLGINKSDLVKGEEDGGYEITRAIGRAAFKKGYEALLVPSITGEGNNLVVFIPNLKNKQKQVRLIETKQLSI